MTLEDMELIASQFVHATRNADRAGFDLIELQAHHGFLLATFLSPLTNKRKDEFGGDITNRLKFPIRVFKEMRAVFHPDKPMSVRISATDWAEGGITEKEAGSLCVRLVQNEKVVCFEIAEVNPTLDKENLMAENTFEILQRVVSQIYF